MRTVTGVPLSVFPTSESPQGLLFTAVLLAAVQVDFLVLYCMYFLVPCISLYVFVFYCILLSFLSGSGSEMVKWQINQFERLGNFCPTNFIHPWMRIIV